MAIENQCTRGIISKYRNGVAAKGVRDGANGFVDEMFCRGFDALWRFKIDQCVNDLTNNEFVSGFKDRVCSRSVRRNVDSFHNGIIKRKLKAVTFKFWTMAMNDFG